MKLTKSLTWYTGPCYHFDLINWLFCKKWVWVTARTKPEICLQRISSIKWRCEVHFSLLVDRFNMGPVPCVVQQLKEVVRPKTSQFVRFEDRLFVLTKLLHPILPLKQKRTNKIWTQSRRFSIQMIIQKRIGIPLIWQHIIITCVVNKHTFSTFAAQFFKLLLI